MSKDRFTTFGLSVAAFGWLTLIADVTFTPMLVSGGNLAPVAALRSDIFSVAETTIFSGFALAILGALRTGFGALNRFFEDVLSRAGATRPAPAAAPYPEAPPVSLDPQELSPVIDAIPQAAQPKPAPNYTILDSGAVEVRTLLGTKVFASFDEARDFIR